MNTTIARCMRTTSFVPRLHQPQTSSTQLFHDPSPFRFLIPHRFSSTSAAVQTASSNRSKVNGPITTIPAPLSLPVRQPNQSFFPSYAFSLGKAYATFYKAGVKNIYANYKASRPIQNALDKKFSGSASEAIHAGFLSRSDFQLLIRNWHDIKRVPVFALVFLVCGEFTPLVVIAISNVVPWTCRIPKQIENDRRKLEQRRAISFRNLTLEPPAEEGGEHMTRMHLLHISWSLGLSSRAWDWFGGQLPGLPNSILRRKVTRRLQYLDLDDKLISEGGGVEELSEEEVRMALVERGVDIIGKGDAQLREDLKAWFKSRQTVSSERLLLTRPSVWPAGSKNLKKDAVL